MLAGRAAGHGALRAAPEDARSPGHAATAWAARAAIERVPTLTWHVLRTRPAGRFLAHRLASRPPEVEVPLIGGVERVARRVLGPQAL